MENENAILDALETESGESFDFDELEQRLQGELDSHLSELAFLEDEQIKIGSPEALGDTILNAVWEQFLNQIGATAGEDFIVENRGLTLDLRNEVHIQTPENFEKQNFATHNCQIDYKKRYTKWQSKFQEKKNSRTDKTEKVITKATRQEFDRGRPKGSATVHKDHIISVAEIMKNPEWATYYEHEDKIKFANSRDNLHDLDSSANESKGDRNMLTWLESKRDGKKPAERFNIDESECRERYQGANGAQRRWLDTGRRRNIESGKQSQRAEFFRIGGKALRTAIMTLLAGLVKEMIQKLVAWFRSAHKSVKTLLEYFKSAIVSFVQKLKSYLVNAASTVVTAVATAIWGPVVRTVSRVITLVKQGWSSLMAAVDYIRNPENKDKPFSILLLEVGKIVMAGVSAGGAILLGEAIEKGLMTFPIFAVEIPLLGSLGSLVGLFMGGMVAGVLGAIVINLIDRALAEKRKAHNIASQVQKGNEILATQAQIMYLNQIKLAATEEEKTTLIRERHEEAAKIMTESLHNIFCENTGIDHIDEAEFSEMDRALERLLE